MENGAWLEIIVFFEFLTRRLTVENLGDRVVASGQTSMRFRTRDLLCMVTMLMTMEMMVIATMTFLMKKDQLFAMDWTMPTHRVSIKLILD